MRENEQAMAAIGYLNNIEHTVCNMNLVYVLAYCTPYHMNNMLHATYESSMNNMWMELGVCNVADMRYVAQAYT